MVQSHANGKELFLTGSTEVRNVIGDGEDTNLGRVHHEKRIFQSAFMGF